jgi:hypothetical protein
MDSLTSMALRNHLQQEFSCTLTATIVFKYPTVVSLSEHLIEAVMSPANGPASDRPAENRRQAIETVERAEEKAAEGSFGAALSELTELEAEALLLERLEKLRY